jgi:GNAT superfamily N-acetyltransferase
MTTNSKGITIRDYEPADQPHFEMLNREWIEQYFDMEPIDISVLQEPEKNILQQGGRILMAICEGSIAGTVALRWASPKVMEFTKMAVHRDYRRRKIGEALGKAAVDTARALGATHIILYSNTVLVPAITLYRKLGFQTVPLDGMYKRSDIKMQLPLNSNHF